VRNDEDVRALWNGVCAHVCVCLSSCVWSRHFVFGGSLACLLVQKRGAESKNVPPRLAHAHIYLWDHGPTTTSMGSHGKRRGSIVGNKRTERMIGHPSVVTYNTTF
jgi:hypothetical protein